MPPQNILELKKSALSSASDALNSIPQIAKIVTRRTHYFPHLQEIFTFWLHDAIMASAILSLDPICLSVHAACLRALNDYLHHHPGDDELVFYGHLIDLWPLLAAYSEKLFAEFSSDLEELTFSEYIPAILDPLCSMIWEMTHDKVDVEKFFYSSLMTDTVVNSMVKSWIKILSRVESYGMNAHCSMRFCLSSTMLKDKDIRGDNRRYRSLFDSVPLEISMSCINNAKDILRPKNRDSEEIGATLDFLVLIASTPANMRVMFFHHHTLETVFRYFYAMARRPPPEGKDLSNRCLTFLELGLNEADRGLLRIFNLRGLKTLLLPSHYVVAQTAIYMYKLIDTMSLQCIDPAVYHHLKRVLRETTVDKTQLPEEIRRPLEVLITTLKELEPAMEHADVRQFRLCTREKCRTNSCQYHCKGCKHAFYCSRRCQKQDWRSHRSKCHDVSDRYRFAYSFALSRFDPDGGWRTSFFDRLVQYELFKGPRRAEIAERRASFIRQHPLLSLQDIAFRMDFKGASWSVDVFQVTDYTILNHLAGYPPDVVCVMWRVPLPSLNELTRGFCVFDGEELMCDPFGGNMIAL
ncbi:hypothetical protein CPB85DRAFT_1339786 [Mucidula mucida]|nr:hypothetical protein CPB85DRAFT_1339786 [Mucidula mucida]